MNLLYAILFNTSVIIAMAGMYFFWFVGGKTGLMYANLKVVKTKGKKHKPNRVLIFLIALMLVGMALICLAQTGSFNDYLGIETVKWGNRFTMIVFLARAIGNFKYVGFTKTFRSSEFANMDTFLISPICLIVASLQFFIVISF